MSQSPTMDTAAYYSMHEAFPMDHTSYSIASHPHGTDVQYDESEVSNSYPYRQISLSLPSRPEPVFERPAHIAPPHPQPIPEHMPRPTLSSDDPRASASSASDSPDDSSPWATDEEGALVPPTPDPEVEKKADPMFPSPHKFELMLYDYLRNLSPKKREKALLTQKMYDSVMHVLQDPKSTDTRTAQFRFWAKKMFTMTTFGGDTVICHDNKPVAVKEQIFEVLVHCHQQAGHGGRDKTSAQVRRYYSWIPKEIIARFVRDCPFCQSRRTQSSSSVGIMSQSQAYLFSLHADDVDRSDGKRKVSLAAAKAQAMAQGYKPYARTDVRDQYTGKVHSVGDSAGQTRTTVNYATGSGPDYYPYPPPQHNAEANMLSLQGMSQQANMGYQPVDYTQYTSNTMTAYGAASIAMGTHYASTTGSSDAAAGSAMSASNAPRSLPAQPYYAYGYSAPPPHLCHRDSYDSTNSDFPQEDPIAEHAHQSIGMVYETTQPGDGSSASSKSSHSSIVHNMAATSIYDPAFYQCAEGIDSNGRYIPSPKDLGGVNPPDEKPAAEQLEQGNPEGLEMVSNWCWDGAAE